MDSRLYCFHNQGMRSVGARLFLFAQDVLVNQSWMICLAYGRTKNHIPKFRIASQFRKVRP